MKQIALSIEQMKYLEKLGLDTSDASMEWCTNDFGTFVVQKGKGMQSTKEYVSTYTLNDILEKLPNEIVFYTCTYNLGLNPQNVLFIS